MKKLKRMTPKSKNCRVCKVHKFLDAFNNNKANKDGKDTDCRKCKNARDRAYFHQNPSYHRSRNQKWHQNNPEKAKAKAKRNKTIRQERLKNAGGGEFNPDREDYQARVKEYGGLCGYCRKAPFEVFDHTVPVSRGGSNHASNIAPSCKKCNLEKGKKVLWTEWKPPIYRNVDFAKFEPKDDSVGFNVAASLAGKYRVNIKPVW